MALTTQDLNIIASWGDQRIVEHEAQLVETQKMIDLYQSRYDTLASNLALIRTMTYKVKRAAGTPAPLPADFDPQFSPEDDIPVPDPPNP